MTMPYDLGAWVLRRCDADVHPLVIEVLRNAFPAEKWPAIHVTYRLRAGVEAIAIDLYGDVDPVNQRFPLIIHHGNGIAEVLARALGCDVWAMTYERHVGFYSAARFGPRGVPSFAQGEGPGPFLGVAAALGTSLDELIRLTESESHFYSTVMLDAPVEPGLLREAVAHWAADPRRQFPGRSEMRIHLPDAVVAELEGVAARLGVDVGLVYWAVWEWAKPESDKRMPNEAGRKRKGPPPAPPIELLPGEPVEVPQPEIGGDRRALTLWLPPRVFQEVNEIAEFCGRGPTSVYLLAWKDARRYLPGASQRSTRRGER